MTRRMKSSAEEKGVRNALTRQENGFALPETLDGYVHKLDGYADNYHIDEDTDDMLEDLSDHAVDVVKGTQHLSDVVEKLSDMAGKDTLYMAERIPVLYNAVAYSLPIAAIPIAEALSDAASAEPENSLPEIQLQPVEGLSSYEAVQWKEWFLEADIEKPYEQVAEGVDPVTKVVNVVQERSRKYRGNEVRILNSHQRYKPLY